MAYRRAALEAVGGFDERFPRAYREDADLGLRAHAAGWRIVRGRARGRCTPSARRTAGSRVRKQAGNADDALMDALHGRAGASAPARRRGRRRAPPAPPRAAGAGARRALAGAAAAPAGAAAGGLGVAGPARLAWRAHRARPAHAREIATMAATSARAAVRRDGLVAARARRRAPARGRARAAAAGARAPCSSTATARSSSTSPTTATRRACEPMPGAREALDRLRARGRAARRRLQPERHRAAGCSRASRSRR